MYKKLEPLKYAFLAFILHQLGVPKTVQAGLTWSNAMQI